MKIADVIRSGAQKGSELENSESEAEKLRKQREQLQKEIEGKADKLEEPNIPIPQENQDVVYTKEKLRTIPDGEEIIHYKESNLDAIDPNVPKEERRVVTREGYNRPPLYKLTFVLEDGSKICPIFECPEQKIESVLEAIDNSIESNSIITIAEYKIIPSRIMYIDLKGRQ